MKQNPRKWMSAGFVTLLLALSLPIHEAAAAAGSGAASLTLEQVAKEIKGKEPQLYVEWKESAVFEDGRKRVEINKTWEDPGNARYRLETSYDESGKTMSVMILNGDDGVYHNIADNEKGKLKLNGRKWNSYSNVSKQRLETILENTSDPVYLGEETMNGRTAYHLSGKSKQAAVKFTDEGGSEKTTSVAMPAREQWFDKQTGVLLKEIVTNPRGGSETVVTEINAAPTFDPGIFNFDQLTGGDEIKVAIDGQMQRFEQPPVIVDGNTLVPLRAIFEKLGASIDWNDKEQSVTAKKGNSAVYLIIGSKNATVNGTNTTLEVPAQIVNGHTMVPVRFIGEALGAEVNWEASSQTVVITN